MQHGEFRDIDKVTQLTNAHEMKKSSHPNHLFTNNLVYNLNPMMIVIKPRKIELRIMRALPLVSGLM